MTAGQLYGLLAVGQGSSGQLKARSSAVHRSAQQNSRMLSVQAGEAFGKMLLMDAAFNVGMKQKTHEAEVGLATHTNQTVVV